ncbi:MAG: hypothetical protein INR71_01170 [Terriglobus roseus]|nr:hypothetical protein [Terriglobus roseus]
MRPLSPESDAAQQKPTSSPLTTNTSFTLAQLPSLKALLDELRPKIEALQDMDAAQGQGRFARERSEYVETQTMRILERRGVDLSEASASKAAGGSGRRIGKEEVEALERIVSVMGGQPTPRRGRDQAEAGASDVEAMEE